MFFKLSSLGCPSFNLRPAIILPFLWVLIPLHYLLIILPPSGSLLRFSILQYGSLFFVFFIKPFHLCVFSALYCCVGEAQGREGTDNALWNRVQLWLHGKG